MSEKTITMALARVILPQLMVRFAHEGSDMLATEFTNKGKRYDLVLDQHEVCSINQDSRVIRTDMGGMLGMSMLRDVGTTSGEYDDLTDFVSVVRAIIVYTAAASWHIIASHALHDLSTDSMRANAEWPQRYIKWLCEGNEAVVRGKICGDVPILCVEEGEVPEDIFRMLTKILGLAQFKYCAAAEIAEPTSIDDVYEIKLELLEKEQWR